MFDIRLVSVSCRDITEILIELHQTAAYRRVAKRDSPGRLKGSNPVCALTYHQLFRCLRPSWIVAPSLVSLHLCSLWLGNMSAWDLATPVKSAAILSRQYKKMNRVYVSSSISSAWGNWEFCSVRSAHQKIPEGFSVCLQLHKLGPIYSDSAFMATFLVRIGQIIDTARTVHGSLPVPHQTLTKALSC